MPYRVQQFINNEIYHIVLRGIDDNLLFKDIDDYYRGIFSIYEFNTMNSVSIKERRKIRIRLKKKFTQAKIARGPSSGTENELIIDERDKLVEVLAFCFMPNHIHLLVKQIKDNGITKFMRKVGTGYAGYFNKKYSRNGYVFQNRFKAINIKDDNQLNVVFIYIHTNPISLIESRWKEKGIKNPKKVIKFLENYKWSSYSDYIGKKNFSSVTEREFLLKTMNGIKGCKELVENKIKYKGKIKEFLEFTL